MRKSSVFAVVFAVFMLVMYGGSVFAVSGHDNVITKVVTIGSAIVAAVFMILTTRAVAKEPDIDVKIDCLKCTIRRVGLVTGKR